MSERLCGCRKRLFRYLDDHEGAATTEWVVAVSIVVMMAVPVLAVIGDGSEEASDDMVISIEDADSFGGGGYQPQDGDEMADLGDEPYNPGADMGVGFPDDEGEVVLAGNNGEGQEGNKVPGTIVDRPRFYASVTGGNRRDKPLGGNGPGGLAGTGGNEAIVAAVVAEEIDIPTPRRTRRYRARNEVCEFDEIVEVDSGANSMVVASGR